MCINTGVEFTARARGEQKKILKNRERHTRSWVIWLVSACAHTLSIVQFIRWLDCGRRTMNHRFSFGVLSLLNTEQICSKTKINLFGAISNACWFRATATKFHPKINTFTWLVGQKLPFLSFSQLESCVLSNGTIKKRPHCAWQFLYFLHRFHLTPSESIRMVISRIMVNLSCNQHLLLIIIIVINPDVYVLALAISTQFIYSILVLLLFLFLLFSRLHKRFRSKWCQSSKW